MNKTFKILLLIIAFTPRLISIAQPGDGAKSENVMAVYIYNFTKFLEWPKDDAEYFYIYVLGKSNLVEPLNKIAEKEKVKGRKIIINELDDVSNLKNNSVLFLSAEDENRLAAILKKANEKNILTVSNSEGFAHKGVCINFFFTDNKIKFEINRKAIEEAGIVPNSRLLSLALRVYN